jgi:hypothetical protein
MTVAEIKALQIRIGATPDGFWGPKSIASCQAHLRVRMPTAIPWPAQDEASLLAFYGHPGDETQLVALDVSGLGVCYEGSPVNIVRCHRKVAPSLLRILTTISASPYAYVLAHYDGCYNDRPMRGGTLPSLHSRAAAIDLFDAENGNLVHWPVVATMPIEVMEIFAAEGWRPAGPFWGRDGAHFQATR